MPILRILQKSMSGFSLVSLLSFGSFTAHGDQGARLNGAIRSGLRMTGKRPGMDNA